MNLGMNDLLKLFQNRNQINQPCVSLALQQDLIKEDVLDAYPKQIRQLYFYLFNPNSNPVKLATKIPLQEKKTQVPVCNKILSFTENAYRCYDCSNHQASVFCLTCFEAGQHQGHRYKKLNSGGGNCDCGNHQAIKTIGFCKHHSGVAEIPQVNPKQIQQFKFYFSYLFQWMLQLRLLNNHKNQFAKLSVMVVKYLTSLNIESLFYNIMTNQLLMEPLLKNNDILLLDHIFIQFAGFPVVVKQICDLYFKMFSLDKFKLNLIKSFTKAYNTNPIIRKSEFHCLYIQLYACDWLAIEISKNHKNVINPHRGQNDLVFYEDFNFISTIDHNAAIELYKRYFDINKVIYFDFLDRIEMQLEQKQEMHIVDSVSNWINQENYYYIIYQNIFSKIKQEKELLLQIIEGLITQINTEHSYIKNRAIIPYHRTFGIALFVLCQGYIDNLSIDLLEEKLKFDKKYLIDFVLKCFKKVVWCLHDFAETYSRKTYFENYLPLYIRSGKTSINYDYLLLKQIAIILHKEGISCEEIMMEVLQSSYLQYQGSKPKGMFSQFFSSILSLISILMEVIVSPVSQLIIAKHLDIRNPRLKQIKKEYFSGLLNTLQSQTQDQLKNVERYFVGNLDDQFLFQMCNFDKNSKKYSAKDHNPTLTMAFYSSKLKILNIFSQKQFDKTLPSYKNIEVQLISKIKLMECEKQCRRITQILLPNNFISNFFSLINLHDCEEKDIILKDFRSQVCKLYLLAGKNIQLVQKIGLLLEKKDEQKQKKQIDLKKIQNIKRKSQKLAKFKAKQNKFMSNLQKKIEEEQIIPQSNKDLCIICHTEQQEEDLWYLGYFKRSNLLSTKLNEKQKTLFFISCEHTVHLKCFRSNLENYKKKNCPLCKLAFNIMIPVLGNSSGFKNKQEVLHRVYTTILQKFQISKNSSVFLQILKAISEQMCRCGLIDPVFYGKKIRNINTILYELLKFIYYSSQPQQKKREQCENYIQELKQKIKMEENQEMITIRSTQILIFESLALSIISQKYHISPKQLFNQYAEHINIQDLKQTIINIMQIITNDQFIFEQENTSTMIKQIPKLRQFLTYYQPPSTVKKLLEQRDSIKQKNCKNGHNVCICCFCSEDFCNDCKTLQIHSATKHEKQMLYLNLQSGGIICETNTMKINTLSLYENQIGHTWSAQKQIEGYALNQQQYGEINKYLMLGYLDYYLQINKSHLITHPAHLFNFE